jgi:hypothetical protein
VANYSDCQFGVCVPKELAGNESVWPATATNSLGFVKSVCGICGTLSVTHEHGGNMELLKSLFDFKFETLVAPKVIRFLYAIFAVVSSIAIVVVTIAGLQQSILSIVIVPFVGFIYMLIIRIVYESLIVKFQVAQDIRAIKNKYISTP